MKQSERESNSVFISYRIEMDQSGTFNQMLKLIQQKVTKKWELSARNNLTSFSVMKLD